jgi:hypothetical protein
MREFMANRLKWAVQILADLNMVAFLFTIGAVAVAAIFFSLLWFSYGGKWQAESAGILVLPLLLAVFSLIQAYDAYSPDADQPHIQKTGPLVPFKNYRYSKGRSSRTGLLACVAACGTNVPLMELDEPISDTLADTDKSKAWTVTYLGRKQWASTGDGYRYTAHPVVEIRDPSTNTQLFYIDTTRHWPRAIVLLFDALLCAAVVIVCVARTEKGAPSSDDENEDSPAK